jgi:putative membrane protein
VKKKKLISKEIENLEKLSSAELVAVITKRSGNYKYASLNGLNILLFF